MRGGCGCWRRSCTRRRRGR
uniref:Uncharacterized protein n=1 Tax=Arundo donax TaxID=35708 RepID=A0A0A9ABL3_ARUDO